MACPVNEVVVKGMRKVHFEQLRLYCDYRGEDGWYYGNKAQFEKRHDELIEWVDRIIKLFEVSK